MKRSLHLGESAAVIAALVMASPSDGAERTLEETLLQSRYSRGEYGVYVGWYDPVGTAFDVHGSYAVPVGVKARLKVWGPLLAEMDLSYYRRGREVLPSSFVQVRAPQFDGLVLGAAMQARLPSVGPIRPYVGGGPVLVSLGNDFVVDLVACGGAMVAECRRLVTWKETDVGGQVVVGGDFHIGRRWSPFAEYRHFFGQVEVGEILDAFLERDPDEIVHPDGSPVATAYDWSGPHVMAGVRIRF